MAGAVVLPFVRLWPLGRPAPSSIQIATRFSMFQALRAAGLLVATAFALPLSAQPAGPAPVAEAGPQERLLPYRSAFEGYRPFADQKLAPWAESNATVGAIGGWRAYAKEAQGAQDGPAPAGPAREAGPTRDRVQP